MRNTLFTANGAKLFHHNLNSLETVGSTSLAAEIGFLAVRDLRIHALIWDGIVSRFVEVAHPLPDGDSDGPPAAALAVVPPTGHTTLTDVTFDASASADLEGPVLYRFDVKDDGTWDTGFTSDPILVRRYSTAGPHRVRVRVKDSMGNVDETVATAYVAFAPDPGGPGQAPPPLPAALRGRARRHRPAAAVRLRHEQQAPLALRRQPRHRPDREGVPFRRDARTHEALA